MCQPGYRGDYCEIAPACAGILDAAGNCCPAGVVSASGACCPPVRSDNGLGVGVGVGVGVCVCAALGRVVALAQHGLCSTQVRS